MRQKLVAGNWKMHGSRGTVRELVEGIKQGLSSLESHAAVAVCPPFVYLADVAALLKSSRVVLGAQDLCDKTGYGAYTGEISGAMLSDLGCTYVIVGHSERRAIYGESDEQVANKFDAAREASLKPILCVGELLEEREAGATETVVGRQLDAVLGRPDGVAALSGAVIAYEPVWAIGTGKTASPEQAQQVHAYIRGRIRAQDTRVGDKIQILYGGSVKAANASELFAMPDIDGGLIGGASLEVEQFLAICKAAS